jgi:hypothetical protein
MFRVITLFTLSLLFPLFICAQQTWNQIGSDIYGTTTDANLGGCVELSNDGETFIVGIQYANGGGIATGSAKVYEWDGTDWIQKGQDLNGEAPGDNAGVSVDISTDGNTVIVGSFFNDGNGTDSGSARVYEWNGTSWIQKGQDLDGEMPGDLAGVSVSINGDGSTVAVGAYYNDNTAFHAGNARVFNWDGSSWVIAGTPINGEAFGDASGYSVSLDYSGGRVAIGAFGNDDGGTDAGHVRVYQYESFPTNDWVQIDQDIDGLNAGDQAGTCVAFSGSGSRLAFGEPRNDAFGADAGRFRAFDLIWSTWQMFDTPVSGNNAGYNFGARIDLSYFGDRIIAGAYKSDTLGAESGEVRVYSSEGVSYWSQYGQTIVGSAGDWTGFGVSISDNGNTIAVGSPLYDMTATNAGLVRIYYDCSLYNPDTTLTWSNDTLTSNANGSYEYQWIDCDNGNALIAGETNQSFAPSVNGTYAVEIFDGKCTKLSQCVTTTGVGINDLNSFKVSYFPNPTDGYLSIIVADDTYQVELSDLTGKLITSSSFSGSNYMVELPTQIGLYFIKMSNSLGQETTFKVVKN